LTVRAVASLPEPDRRAYVRTVVLAEVDPGVESLMLGALPPRAAAAFGEFLRCLREWV
jgi:hypothetical protein